MDSFDREFAKIEEEYYAKPKDELFESIEKQGTRVVIFGAGAVGCTLAGSLDALSGKLAAFCDNYKSGFNEQLEVPIISPMQLQTDYKDAIVIVAVDYKYNDEIYSQVLKMGFSREKVFQRYSGYEQYNLNLFKRHLDGYRRAYHFFEDDISRKVVLDRIRAYLFYHEFEHSPCELQYFEDGVISFSEKEVFVDGGCYIGDTAMEFIKKLNGKYSYIYGFEPETENYKKAMANLSDYTNIEIINKGLWHKDDILSIGASGSSSKILDSGMTSMSGCANLTSLDNFFAGKQAEELPTFIKLDIEGAEKQALLGAKSIIEKAHPKLAICVYHKVEDIYELPRIISEYGQYKYKLRHYSKNMCETVLYAVQ